MTKGLFLVLILLIVLPLIAFVVGATFGGGAMFAYANNQQNNSLEAEYYRGLYDVCHAQMHIPDLCLEIVIELKSDDWYNRESLGWHWPLARSGGHVDSYK